MALTPNLRKVGSLLGTDVLGEHDSRVMARSVGAPLNDTVVVAVGRAALLDGTVLFAKAAAAAAAAAGRLIRSRSSTRKLECAGKTDGSVCGSGRPAAAGRYSCG